MAGRNTDKVYILNVGISAIDMDDACVRIEETILKKHKIYICACPVSTIMACKRDKNVLAGVNSADLATPDGMAVVWIGRLLGYKDIRRVYGPELMQHICDIAGKKGYRSYFYGSTQGVLNKLKENLLEKYPGLIISGMYSPPFRQLTRREDDKAVGDINRSNSDIIWVGLGSPKQDLWMYEHRGRINASVMIGIGAAFDFLAGTKLQAPRFIRNSGFEWLFRLITEPKRLWKRYLIGNSIFLWLFLKEFVKIKILRKKSDYD